MKEKNLDEDMTKIESNGSDSFTTATLNREKLRRSSLKCIFKNNTYLLL
jgi:hypothetical protein